MAGEIIAPKGFGQGIALTATQEQIKSRLRAD
jgi:hypothetical protein